MNVVCFIWCLYFVGKSAENIKKKIIDNGAQNAVTIGVLFTFIGIAWSLYFFDTNPDTMAVNIQNFLDGMKTAFCTSIIGMLFGLYIKSRQIGVEQDSDKDALDSLKHLNRLNQLDELYSINGEIKNFQNTASYNNKAFLDAITSQSNMLNLRLSSISAQLQKQHDDLDLSSIKEFTKALTNISSDLNAFSQEQKNNSTNIKDSFESNISKLGDTLGKRIEILTKNMQAINHQQANTTSEISNDIAEMKRSTISFAKDMNNLLISTRDYQDKSLKNDESFATVMTNNTNSIIQMKESFDDFLKNMAENYSSELIHALNMSMDKLNTQLQTQFGENFKELNSAVKETVVWQENYKDIVNTSTEELKEINKIFKNFQDTMQKQFVENLAVLSNAIQQFTETTNTNKDAQQQLQEVTVTLNKCAVEGKQNTESMHEVIHKLNDLSDGIKENVSNAVDNTNKTIATQFENMIKQQSDRSLKYFNELKEEENAFEESIKKLNRKAFDVTTDVEQYLHDFNTTSKDIMKQVRLTLEAFNSDFDKCTKTELGSLKAIFEQLAKNTDLQQDKAIKQLAGTLGVITTRIIGDYNALINKIHDLDVLIQNEKEGR